MAWSSLLWACAAKNDPEAMKGRFASFFERKNGLFDVDSEEL